MSDEEEDYMSMVIEEPAQKESFTQRKRREQREVRYAFPLPLSPHHKLPQTLIAWHALSHSYLSNH